MDATDTEILEYNYINAYNNINSVSMTNEEWKSATEEAEKLTRIAQNTSSDEWFNVVDDFYTT